MYILLALNDKNYLKNVINILPDILQNMCKEPSNPNLPHWRRPVKYGIRMVTVHWACENGGDDYTGTREEIEAQVATWKREGIPPNVRYDVILYTGEIGNPPAFPSPPANSRNSRMK